MRLADDDRGRVPFAVVGVLLLLGSTAFATTLGDRGPVREDRSADRAVERVEANAAAALRGAVRSAARAAAREPVTRPANTPFGRVVGSDEPFRDALRIRIYLAARDRLRRVRYRHEDVVGRASLPPTPTPAALREAKRRIEVEAVENGTALSVRIEGVNYTATRDGRRVATRTRTTEVTVATPVLALHDRTRRFERRLDRGPLAGPGLGRRLTARLYPLVWARAYAQRAGAPVENVLANRHVAASTNGAVLDTQRAVFGRSDPDGRRGFRRALTHLAARDFAGPLRPASDRWTRRVLVASNGPPDRRAGVPRFDAAGAPGPDRRFVVGVNRTADAALGRLLAGDANRSLPEAISAGYRVTGRLRTATREIASDPRPAPVSPGDEFDLVETRTSADADVRNASAPTPALGPGERRLVTHERRVSVERRATWIWENGNETERTHATWSARYRVGVSVTVEPDRRAPGPNRTVRPAFERGGPLDGPNLADTPERVRSRLVAGGPDEVVADVVLDRLETRQVRVVGERPDGLRRRVYTDLIDFRERLGNVTTAVGGGRLATGRATPVATLAERLRENRSALVGAPETYHGAAERARIAARTAYFDAVVAALDRRAAARRERMERLGGVLADAGAGSPDRLFRTLRAARSTTAPERETLRGPTAPVRLVPDASPPYLTVAGVERARVDAVPDGESYHPLAARNRNLFTAPYDDAVDRVVGSSRGADLRVAGATLAAADAVPTRRSSDDFADRRRRLADATRRALGPVRDRATLVLRRHTSLGQTSARTAVREAMKRWDGYGPRALAATNGSFAAAVADEAGARLRDSNATFEDRLETRLRLAVGRAIREGGARVDEALVADVRTAARDAAKEAIYEAARREVPETVRTRWVGDVFAGVPAGMPVAPVPGYWYATTNVWTVQVRGAYARFTLRTRRGAPGETLRYVRDGSTVRLDVDGDGEDETVGYDERVAFGTNTTVAVAVPPGGGVGDVDGNADERSGGWPRPACLGPRATCPDRTE
ncbi:MAG: hypothetical protein ABEH47_07235 [Haloferacaceae archaeon]